MHTLQECPFCGHIPIIEERYINGEGDRAARVVCISDVCEINPATQWYDWVPGCVASWNIRPNDEQ
jgi:hypothetical protein